MNVTIRINCDNAAFEDSAGGEVARILRKLASTIEDQNQLTESDERHLMDLNGNRVGQMKVSE